LSRSTRFWLLAAVLIFAVYCSALAEVQAIVQVWTNKYNYYVGETVIIYMRSTTAIASSTLVVTGPAGSVWSPMGAFGAGAMKTTLGPSNWPGFYTVTFTGGGFTSQTSYYVQGGWPPGPTPPWPPQPVTVTTTMSVTTTTHPPDFKLDMSPLSGAVKLGETATFTVTVSSIAGFNSDVQLEVSGSPALPAGSALVTPSSVKPPSDDSGKATLAVNTRNFDSSGSYTITVTGRSGSSVRTTGAQLEVKSPMISVSLFPESQIVKQGASTQLTINVDVGDYKGPVSIAVTGIPPGATKSISPSSLTGSGAVTLTITTTDQTQAGTYPIQVSVSAGGAKTLGQALLTVKEKTISERLMESPEILALLSILGAAAAAVVGWTVLRRKPSPPLTAPPAPPSASYPALRPAAVSYPPPAAAGVRGGAICFGCGLTIPAGATTCPRCGKPK